jgi:hypothetical protein
MWPLPSFWTPKAQMASGMLAQALRGSQMMMGGDVEDALVVEVGVLVGQDVTDAVVEITSCILVEADWVLRVSVLLGVTVLFRVRSEDGGVISLTCCQVPRE